MQIIQDLKKKIGECRSSGYTLEEIAEAIGTTRGMLWKYFDGRCGMTVSRAQEIWDVCETLIEEVRD